MSDYPPGMKLRPIGDRIDFRGPVPEGRPDLGPCWIWTGARTAKGYAERVQIDGVRIQPYRLLWTMLHGPFPAELVPDHLCRNRLCVNPAHIEPVTSRENTMRGESFAARHALVDRCPSGHPYDEQNTRRYRGRRYCRACNNGGSGRLDRVGAAAEVLRAAGRLS